jgi:hypothetical protein
MTTFREQCKAITKGGERCRGNVVDSEGFCFTHSPELMDRRREGSSRGGKHKSSIVRLEKLMPERLAPVYSKLETVLDQLHSGRLDPKIAHAMAAVARVMVSVLQVGEMEERLRTLEEKSQSIADAPPIRRLP